MLSMITTFLYQNSPPPWQPNPCFQWLLHSFYQNLTPPPLATHAFNDSGSSITFLLSRIWHSFYQNFPPPLGNPTHALNDYYIPFIKIWPPPLATHAFNDSGSSTTFFLSRFLHFFYQHFPFPLGNPTHAFNDYYIPFIKNSPPCQPNPCFQWLLHSFYKHFSPLATLPCFQWLLNSFYQKFPSPLGNPTHAFNDYYILFIQIWPPPLGNPCFQWFRFKYYIPFFQDFYIPFINISLPLGNPTHAFNDYYIPFGNISPPWQPSHAFNDYYIPFIKISPPWQPMLSMIQVQVLHSFYQHFYIPFINIRASLGNPTHAFNDYYIPFIKNSPPCQPNPCFQWLLHSFYPNLTPPPLATHAFNDSGSSTTFLFFKIFTFLLTTFPSPLATQPMLSMITTFLLSTFDFPLGNPCFQWFRFKYYIPFIEIFIHIPFISISPPLATQPMLSMITTFLL